MADTAAHLVDRVLPPVPVRQWVLSLPFALRYRLAYDASLVNAVLGCFVRAVLASLRQRARRRGLRTVQCGAVTFLQRFGDALNLNVHFHSLALDGVYARTQEGSLRFHPLPPPDDAEVARLAGQLAPLADRPAPEALEQRLLELEARIAARSAELDAALRDAARYKGRWETLDKAYVILRGELELKKHEARAQRVALERLRALEVVLTAPESPANEPS
jgi:hypothetical protein